MTGSWHNSFELVANESIILFFFINMLSWFCNQQPNQANYIMYYRVYMARAFTLVYDAYVHHTIQEHHHTYVDILLTAIQIHVHALHMYINIYTCLPSRHGFANCNLTHRRRKQKEVGDYLYLKGIDRKKETKKII